MATIRITTFKGMAPAVAPKLLRNEYAQIAHNTLLRDGTLRPYAKWQRQASIPNAANSIVFNKKTNNVQYTVLAEGVKLIGAPFPPDGIAGIHLTAEDQPIGYVRNSFSNISYPMSVEIPQDELMFNFQITGTGGVSAKPVNRVYGFTIARYNGVGYEEGPITLMPLYAV